MCVEDLEGKFVKQQKLTMLIQFSIPDSEIIIKEEDSDAEVGVSGQMKSMLNLCTALNSLKFINY